MTRQTNVSGCTGDGDKMRETELFRISVGPTNLRKDGRQSKDCIIALKYCKDNLSYSGCTSLY